MTIRTLLLMIMFRSHTIQGNALTDVSFNILPGQTIGVIGGTGSGKTTLINPDPSFL